MTRIPQSELKARLAYRAVHGNESGFVPEPRKKRNNEESQMQRALIKWWQANCRIFGVPEILLFSIPNGGNGDARRGSIMKAEGQRKGAPDLFLAVSRSVRVDVRLGADIWWKPLGLFLELKTAQGRLSPEQEVFHEHLANQGYKVVVCRSLPECINQITAYLT